MSRAAEEQGSVFGQRMDKKYSSPWGVIAVLRNVSVITLLSGSHNLDALDLKVETASAD